MTDIIVELGSGGASNLNGLTDVNTAGAVDGQVLTWDAGTLKWVPTAAAGVTTLAALDDTNTAGITNGQILIYNSGTGDFEAGDLPAGGSATWGGITGTLSAQTDLQSALDAKANTSHTHTTGDITDLASYTGLDIRYYTETEVDTALSGKANTSHTHTTSDITDLASYTGLDTRYYTETETDTLLSGKAASVHTHVKADITDFSDGDYATAAQGTLAGTATQPGDNISTLTNDSGFITGITSESLEDLGNVTITTPTSGQVLKYNGTIWINDTDATAGGTTNLDDLGDVQITAPLAGEVIRYNGSQWVDSVLSKADISDFIESDYATGAEGDLATTALQDLTTSSISTLQDVNIHIPLQAGYLLSWNVADSQWKPIDPTTLPSGPTNVGNNSIGELSDVTITAAANGEVLKYNGTAWVDANVDYSELTGVPATFTPTAHTHVKADITDFNEADYATGAEGDLATTALQDITGESVGSLSDVVITTPSTNAVLKWNGTTAWIDGAVDYSELTSVPSTFTPSAHTHVKADITDFSDGDYATAAQGTLADNAIPSSEKAAANGVATLDAGSKIPTNQLPALALTEINTVANEAAQLALTAQEGDIAIRTDENKSYAHNGGSAGTMADWSELLTPTDAVLSVDGRTGAVTLSDLYASASHTHTTSDITDLASYTGFDARYYTEGETDTLLAGKADSAHTHVKADITDLVEEDYFKIKVSATDTTADYLTNKIVDGLGIVASTLNGGADEDYQLQLGPHYLSLASTGLYKGGELSTGAAQGTIDISAGEGLYADSTTAFPTVSVQPVIISARTNFAITNIATQPVTYIMIDKDDNVVQLGSFPTPSQRRDNIFLGVAVHSNNVDVQFVNNLPSVSLDATAQTHDLMKAFGFFSLDGNIISANGANLSINKSAGTAFKEGGNFHTNPKDPHTVTLGAKVLSTFRYRNQDSSEGLDITVLDPTTYDNGGTTTTVPANNNATIQRVYVFPSNEIRIQRGQTVYNNLSAAVDAIGKESFVTEPNIEQNGLLLASIVMTKTASDLTDPSEALVFTASRFGDLGSVGSAAVGTLQDVYDNSVDPEVIISDTVGGALTVKDSATNTNRDNIFEVTTTADAEVFGVTRTDVNVTGNIAVTGTVDGRDIATDGALLDTALQPGQVDNVSELVNDAGYLTVSTDTLQTTDATTTVLSTVAIPSGEEKILVVKVHGHEDATNDHIWKTMTFCVKNVGGTASLVGGVDSAIGYDAGATSWSIVAGVSTGNATITVTGEAAHTIDWRATIQLD